MLELNSIAVSPATVQTDVARLFVRIVFRRPAAIFIARRFSFDCVLNLIFRFLEEKGAGPNVQPR
jgi:hypothetical protein